MKGVCKDCRFYDGKNCAVRKSATTMYYSCDFWASNISSGTKKCKDCRFYDGASCIVNYGRRTAPASTCSRWAAFR